MSESSNDVRRYIAEVIGTFALVFAGTGAIIINDMGAGASVTHLGVGLVFGLIVTAMIYSIGDVSGAHINPAVTIAFWAAKRFEGKYVVPYIIAQLIGAFLASVLLRAMFMDHPNLGSTLPAGSWTQSFLLEVVLTFILMFVILNVSIPTPNKQLTDKQIMAAVAVGSTVALEAIFAGPICGASMNPARSIAPAVVSGNVLELWMYIAAPTIGALLAVPACWAIRGKDEVA